MRLHIGILQTDSVLDQFQGEFGNYPGMFRGLLSLPGDAVSFTDFDIRHGDYPKRVDECDAYVITGSRNSVYDDEPWIHRLIDYVVELNDTKSKLIGVCFGHQMVAHALGGRTEAAACGWRVGVHHNEVVRHEPFMTPELKRFNLIFSHRDQVTKLPPDAELLASSPGCPYAMFRLGQHILTFQGHPEFCKGYSRALMEYREETLGKEKFDSGIESLVADTNERTIGQWVLNFIREDRVVSR